MEQQLPWGTAELMTKVARLYHQDGMRQAEIAERLNLSQASVSRLLARARDAGIVRTTIVPPDGVHSDLEHGLRERFALIDAVVVDDPPPGADAATDLGNRAAPYLQATLAAAPILGVSSWSATLLAAATAMGPARVPAGGRVGDECVVQMVGGHGDPRVQAQAARLLSLLAAAMGARPVALPAPAGLASREARDALIEDPALAPVTSLWEQATTALVGIGAVEPSPMLRDSGNAWDGEDRDELLRAGAVGDICLRFIDGAGAPVSSRVDERVVGITLETLVGIPRRIAVAGGAIKVPAIRAALTGGWINVIITDRSSAEALLVE